MDKSPRNMPKLLELYRLFSDSHSPISSRIICERMEISLSTFKRLKDRLADVLNAPVEYDRTANGYRFSHNNNQKHEIPGLWLSGEEIASLLLVKEILQQLSLGGLESLLSPLQRNVKQLLTKNYGSFAAERLSKCVEFRPQFQRKFGSKVFLSLIDALIRNICLEILYQSRGHNEETHREISPLRMLYYRDNWYLCAFCHLRNELRVFSLDRIKDIDKSDATFVSVHETEQELFFSNAYGIFTGPSLHTAVLRFSKKAARWVEESDWHPEQVVRHLSDGQLEIDVPYGDDRELVMDILKYGPEVEVVSPQELREVVVERILQTMEVYSGS